MPELIYIGLPLISGAAEIGMVGISIVFASALLIHFAPSIAGKIRLPRISFPFARLITKNSAPGLNAELDTETPSNPPEHDLYASLGSITQGIARDIPSPQQETNAAQAQKIIAAFCQMRRDICANSAVKLVQQRLNDNEGLSTSAAWVLCLALHNNAQCAFERIPALIAAASGRSDHFTQTHLMPSATDELGNRNTPAHSQKLEELIGAIGDVFGFSLEQFRMSRHLIMLRNSCEETQYRGIVDDLLHGHKGFDANGRLIDTTTAYTCGINPNVGAVCHITELAAPLVKNWRGYIDYLVTHSANQQPLLESNPDPYVASLILNAYHEAVAAKHPTRTTHIEAIGRIRSDYAPALPPSNLMGADHAAIHNDAEHAKGRPAASVEEDHAALAQQIAEKALLRLAQADPTSALATLQTAIDRIKSYQGFWRATAALMDKANAQESCLSPAWEGDAALAHREAERHRRNFRQSMEARTIGLN